MREIYIRNKEAVAMMLRQHIESGFAEPPARTALYKIQKAHGNYVDGDEREAEAIIDVYRSFAEDRSWTPMTGEARSHRGIQPYQKEMYGPTRYPEIEEERY